MSCVDRQTHSRHVVVGASFSASSLKDEKRATMTRRARVQSWPGRTLRGTLFLGYRTQGSPSSQRTSLDSTGTALGATNDNGTVTAKLPGLQNAPAPAGGPSQITDHFPAYQDPSDGFCPELTVNSLTVFAASDAFHTTYLYNYLPSPSAWLALSNPLPFMQSDRKKSKPETRVGLVPREA